VEDGFLPAAELRLEPFGDRGLLCEQVDFLRRIGCQIE
jgi:hypothetical protein